MTKLDKEEKTAVTCPKCGKALKTWGVNYFNHCGQRHSVVDNLAEEEPEEIVLTENDLEEDEKLVKCEKCGEFLITTEEEQFEHCGVKQSVKDSLADFDEFNGGENEEEGEKGATDPKATVIKTRTVLPKGKKAGKERKGKKDDKADETREEKEESNKGKTEPAEEGEPDKEAELWTCIDCGCDYNDNGYSDATCPDCGCEYAAPYEE